MTGQPFEPLSREAFDDAKVQYGLSCMGIEAAEIQALFDRIEELEREQRSLDQRLASAAQREAKLREAVEAANEFITRGGTPAFDRWQTTREEALASSPAEGTEE